MPYCSSEGKFQGFDEELEIEVDSVGVSFDDTEGQVLVELTMRRNCAGCSQEVATMSDTIQMDFEHECPKADDENEVEFEEEGFDEPEMVDEYVRETQSGKYKGKKGRFQTHLLGASINGSVKCSLCDETIELDGEVKNPASLFEAETSH